MTRTPDPQEALVLERIANGQEAHDRAAACRANGAGHSSAGLRAEHAHRAQFFDALETHWLTGALFADRGDMAGDFVTFELEQRADGWQELFVFHSGACVERTTLGGFTYKAALAAGRGAANRHRESLAQAARVQS